METSVSRTEAVFLSGASSPDKRLVWGTFRHPHLSLRRAPRGRCRSTQRRILLPGSLARDAHQSQGVNAMERIYACCCGLDVHKKTIVACLLTARKPKEIQSFRTTTQELLRLRDWLQAAGCTHVAMEATGVYWKPVYNLLEDAFELLVVNAQHIKAVPGRKTDIKDAEWIADLLQHGLLRGSFIPPRPQRELRDLTRYRSSLVQERTRTVNRLQKTLEDTNLKLGDVVSDIMGRSAQEILEALLGGQTDPARLADLARGRLKAKRAQLEEALVGTLRPHHRFLLAEQLLLMETLDEAIARVSEEIDARIHPPKEPPPTSADPAEPAEVSQEDEERSPAQEGSSPPDVLREPLSWEEAVPVLDSIPGINRRIAEAILAEIGTDMSRFPTARHLASWAGMSPGNHQSAGKRLSGRTRKGNPALRQHLVEAAQGAAHTKQTYLSTLYKRFAARRGAKRAMIAVGHTILTIVYHVLSRHTSYQELGANYLDERDRQAAQNRYLKGLQRLGFEVTLQPAPQVA